MSAELQPAENIKYISIKMKKRLKNNSEIIYLIKDAGELCVKILLFLLCCQNPEKIDFEFMKNSVAPAETNEPTEDEEIIKAVDFWKEKDILDYEITSPVSVKGVNMYNVINILLNIKRDINILNGEESDEHVELDEGLGIYGDRYKTGKNKKESKEPKKTVEIIVGNADPGVPPIQYKSDETDDEIVIIETEEEIEIREEIKEEEVEVETEEKDKVDEINEIKHVSFNPEPVSIVAISESLETKEEFRRLVVEAQGKMQVVFNFADLEIMYNLHEAKGMEVDLILKLAEICAEEGKNNIRYLEKVALGYASGGIFSLKQYEEKMQETYKLLLFEDKIKKLFKIDDAKLKSKEKNHIRKWAREFNFSDEVLTEGYKRCIKQIQKLSFDYINTIYTNWHEKGFKTLEDINNEYGNNHEIINNLAGRKNAGVNIDQLFEKAVRKGVKF